MNLAPGITIGGKYRLERKIASGGQGSVWVARHIQLHAEVAVKFLDLGQSDDNDLARVRFEREARAAAGIRHPNLVHVQDIGDYGGTPFLVMEFFKGESLDRRLKTRKVLDLATTANILLPIARGLRRLHEAGFVHRDIKPSNIFLAINDEGDEVVKILDFGIVKEINHGLVSGTQTGEFVGSPSYMSPEQLRASKAPDIRSDVWSVGVILYQALTGSRPFEGNGVSNIIVEVLTGTFVPPSRKNPALPPAIDAFFAKALNRKVEERFQTMKEMADTFVELSGSRVSLPPANPPPSGAMPPVSHVNLSNIAQRPQNQTQREEIVDEISAYPEEEKDEDQSDLMATIPLEQARMKALQRPIGGTQKLPSSYEIEEFLAKHPENGRMQQQNPGPANRTSHPSYPVFPNPGYSIQPQAPIHYAQGHLGPAPSHTLGMAPQNPPGAARDRPTPTKPLNNQWLVKGLLMGVGLGLILVLLLLLILR